MCRNPLPQRSHCHLAFFLAPRFLRNNVGSLKEVLGGTLTASPTVVICGEGSDEGVVWGGCGDEWEGCGVVWRGCSDEKARKIGFESARIGIN